MRHLSAELESVRAAAEEQGRTAEAALQQAESLAHSLNERGRQLDTAEQQAAQLSEQLAAAKRTAAAAQAERDTAVTEVRVPLAPAASPPHTIPSRLTDPPPSHHPIFAAPDRTAGPLLCTA